MCLPVSPGTAMMRLSADELEWSFIPASTHKDTVLVTKAKRYRFKHNRDKIPVLESRYF